jgi:hypothetical protein
MIKFFIVVLALNFNVNFASCQLFSGDVNDKLKIKLSRAHFLDLKSLIIIKSSHGFYLDTSKNKLSYSYEFTNLIKNNLNSSEFQLLIENNKVSECSKLDFELNINKEICILFNPLYLDSNIGFVLIKKVAPFNKYFKYSLVKFKIINSHIQICKIGGDWE